MPQRRALSLVAAFAGGGAYLFKHLAPVPANWRTFTVGRRYRSRSTGEVRELAYLLIEEAEPPLSQPVLVWSVAEWEETGRTLPRPGETRDEGLFVGGFAKPEERADLPDVSLAALAKLKIADRHR